MADIKETQAQSSRKNADKVLKAFFDISNAASVTTNLDELYVAIHKALGNILNVDNFAISIHNKDKDSISFPYWIDEKDPSPGELLNFRKTRSLTGEIILGERPRFYTNQDLVAFAKQKNQQIVGTMSMIWMGAPLIVKTEVIGVIAVQSYSSEDDYERSDLDILSSASHHIAIALERKITTDALKKQRHLLEKIIETSPVGISLVDNTVFRWVNNEMLKLFGYSKKEDLENKNFKLLCASKKDYDKVNALINSGLATKGKADFEYALMRKNGTLFPAHIVIVLADTKEPSLLTIAIVTDLSARRNVEEEKQRSEKLKGVLETAGAVSYELNQPLQAILGYAELLFMDRGVDKKETVERLKKIVKQVGRIGKITKNLSSITQYKTKKYVGDVKISDIWDADEKKKK